MFMGQRSQMKDEGSYITSINQARLQLNFNFSNEVNFTSFEKLKSNWNRAWFIDVM